MNHKVRWTAERIERYLSTLEPLVYRRQLPLPPFRLRIADGPEDAPLADPQLDDSGWPLVENHHYWADWFRDFTLRTTYEVPAEWPDNEAVALYLQLGITGDFSHPEALVYIDGQPYAGCDRHHQEVLLPPAFRHGRHYLALHGWTGRGGWQAEALGSRPLMGQCRLVQIDTILREFLATARVALGTARAVSDMEPAHGHLLNALATSFNQLDLFGPPGEAFYQSVGQAQRSLQAGITAAGVPLDVTVVAAGHAHIDVAWLWTLGQTRRKAGRTFHTVLRYMEQFPTYHFTQSQPQLYDYVRQDYPELFAAVKQRVKEERWEAIGGMWVEADCNLSGAEALARQFVLGRSFFREHFGVDAESPVLWLPDVFGYAWALPQLIKQAGLEYFFTIKIGWSQYNRLPYDSFWWQGLDGSKVLTHFSTSPEAGDSYASTYNAKATPASILGTWQNFQQKELQHTLLMAYGYGDGGGGPTREMLENLALTGSGMPALPLTRQAKVIDFFRAMEDEAGTLLPTWNGELYLEYHRGTYTTQARNKRANRKGEFLLHDAEFLAAYAALLANQSATSAYTYPHQPLNEAWKLLCLNQFHDIIPGSSIAEVYDDSAKDYETIARIGSGVKADALAFIGSQVHGDLLLVNPTSFVQDGPVLWDGLLAANQALLCAGSVVDTQEVEDGMLLDPGIPLPPYSITPLFFGDNASQLRDHDLHASSRRLENEHLRVMLNDQGDIISIFDKVGQREVLPAGAVANQFQAFEDRPLNWDAWDIEIYYDDKMILAQPADEVWVLESGPLRAALRIRRRLLSSTITQTISLSHDRPQIDFATHVDWRERHVLLKVAFPVDVLAPAATYEIQWGSVERPTHRNTSWDWARFETCAHKWVDLSEGDYGVSLLNDCKYGHDIQDNVLRLSLLRGTTHPDPQADLGEHHFTYSLRPHKGRWNMSTIAAAYALNDPPFAARGGGQRRDPPVGSTAGNPWPFIACDQENVIIETIKFAEDGRGLIVRLYESRRQRGWIELVTAFELAGVWRTNLLEEEEEALQYAGNSVRFFIKPFEIVTVRLIPVT